MLDVEEVVLNELIRVQHELEHSIGKYFITQQRVVKLLNASWDN